jgi:transcriptional regulator with XRE-family HTH domain
MHNLSKMLRILRKQKNLTLQNVADYLNISRTAYNHYELGRREPDVTNLIKLAELFGVSLDILTGRYVNAYADNRISVENNGFVNGGINIRQVT